MIDMGFLETRWEATYEGHSLAVFRDELTKGFLIEWDGVVIARRTWSWVGLGELNATAEVDGEPVEVKASLKFGIPGKCVITVDGTEIPVKQVK